MNNSAGAPDRPKFSIREARALIKDLTKPNPWIYWTDFLMTILTGHVLFHTMLELERITGWTGVQLWTVRLILFAAVSILYMRGVMFIHELVHLPKGKYRGFRIAWNALCGIPFLVPSFLYYPHVDHHRRKHYGTDRDGEYLELSHRPPWHTIAFILAALVVPFAGFIRFAILAPISWISPKLQQWVEKHASSMVVDIFYTRGDFGPKARRIMRMQEVLCFLWCIFLVARAPLFSGQLIDGFLIHAYFLGVTLVAINNVRTLGAHRWMGDGREMSFEEQLVDSVNYPYRPWFTELWGPVGTRYHAIHHLFPSIPYHNLPKAHKRLMEGLPADSIYRETIEISLIGAIYGLLRRSYKNSRQRKWKSSRRTATQNATAA